MGLDMYVNSHPPGKPDNAEEIHYFRKHPNLHGWMEQLYRSQGGEEESFNCVRVYLTVDDLLKLRKDVMENNLPHTEGFFFGKSYPEDNESTLHMIEKALDELESGNVVYYTSWW